MDDLITILEDAAQQFENFLTVDIRFIAIRSKLERFFMCDETYINQYTVFYSRRMTFDEFKLFNTVETAHFTHENWLFEYGVYVGAFMHDQMQPCIFDTGEVGLIYSYFFTHAPFLLPYAHYIIMNTGRLMAKRRLS